LRERDEEGFDGTYHPLYGNSWVEVELSSAEDTRQQKE
jgi:hypothetical protein